MYYDIVQIMSTHSTLTVTLGDGPVPLPGAGAEEAGVALQDVAEVAHELDHVAESVQRKKNVSSGAEKLQLA